MLVHPSAVPSHDRPLPDDPLPDDPLPDDPVLDNPAWASLTGRHARFAEIHGCAARYLPDVSPFTAVADGADRRVWLDLAELVGPDAPVVVTGALVEPPPGWTVVERGTGVQFVETALEARPDPDAVRLGPGDVADMLDLVERTRPGPFLPRTVELGTYLGIRRAGQLVAMAGERLQPPGWTEISAVCTDPAVRGQGLATRLVAAVAHGIRARGDRAFLHTAAENAPAIRLYGSIGFTLRRRTTFAMLRTPPAARRDRGGAR